MTEVLKVVCLCGKEIRVTGFEGKETIDRDKVSGRDHRVHSLATATVTRTRRVSGICLDCGDVEIIVTGTTKERS